MNKYPALAPLAVAGLILTACSATETPTDPFPPPAETYGPFVSESTSMPPRASDMAVGQPNAMTLDNGVALEFTIDSMTKLAGVECPSGIYDGPPDKQFIRLDYTVRTGDTVPADYTSLFSPFLWKVRGDDGKVIDDAGMDEDASMCVVDDGADFYEWETNSIYNAALILPQQGSTGTIILDPSDYETTDRFEMRY
jgi:hypothetical protein